MKSAGVLVGLLSCAMGSVAFASALWGWVLDFDPAFDFTHAPVPTGTPLSPSVTILLIDGLRLDASRRMPTLNQLRSRGADIEAQVGTPSFSRPGRATIAVGAPPSIHGVTTNRQKRALSMDNLVRRVAEIGGTCRVAGSKIWSDLFSEDIARCGSYLRVESKEGPGTFVTNIGGVRASEGRGIAFALEEPVMLRVIDVVATDFAAHEYGGASPEYQAEVARTDQTLAELLGHLDLSKETLVVTADHGHRDLGGHGGQEPDVLAIPVVMAGLGIRPATSVRAQQADIAPTVAAILGAALPKASSGHPLEDILLADQSKLKFLRSAAEIQQEAFSKAVGKRLGISSAGGGTREWPAFVHEYRDTEMSGRIKRALFLGVVIVLMALLSIRAAQPGAFGLSVGLFVSAFSFVLMTQLFLPPMSFSAINYDDSLIPFFRNLMAMAAGVAAWSIALAVIARRLFGKGAGAGSAVALAGSVGFGISTALAVATAIAWVHHGLLSPLTIPGSDSMVESFALTLALTAVSMVSLLMMAILWMVERRSRQAA